MTISLILLTSKSYGVKMKIEAGSINLIRYAQVIVEIWIVDESEQWRTDGIRFFLSEMYVWSAWKSSIQNLICTFKKFLYTIQKAVDLSKDDLLGDILQDLNTEVSEFPGVIRYRGIDWRNSSVIIQNKLSLERNVPGYHQTCTYKIPPYRKENKSPQISFFLTVLGFFSPF